MGLFLHSISSFFFKRGGIGVLQGYGFFLSIFKEICIVLVINQKQCKLLIFVEKLNSVGFVFVIRLKLLTVMTF